MDEHGGESALLAAVYTADQLTRSNDWTDLRNRLRHVWRHLLKSPLLSFTPDALSPVSRPGVRTAADLAESLDQLAHEWTRAELHTALADCLDTHPNRIRVTRAQVRRNEREQTVDMLEIDDPSAALDSTTVNAAFAVWAATDPARDYLRITHPTTQRTAVWDRTKHDCWWIDRTIHDDEQHLKEPTPPQPAWSLASQRLAAAAQTVDQPAA